MTVHLPAQFRELSALCRLERHAFAAKVRLARAVLGWSQSELAFRVGLTQRAIHKLEQGDTEPRRTTLRAMEFIWREQGIEFEDFSDGGFRVSIRSAVIEPSRTQAPAMTADARAGSFQMESSCPRLSRASTS